MKRLGVLVSVVNVDDLTDEQIKQLFHSAYLYKHLTFAQKLALKVTVSKIIKNLINNLIKTFCLTLFFSSIWKIMKMAW